MLSRKDVEEGGAHRVGTEELRRRNLRPVGRDPPGEGLDALGIPTGHDEDGGVEEDALELVPAEPAQELPRAFGQLDAETPEQAAEVDVPIGGLRQQRVRGAGVGATEEPQEAGGKAGHRA